MNIPDTIRLKQVQHGHGANGFALYVWEDNEGLGISKTEKRQQHGVQWTVTWTIDALPNREFSTFADLREAVLPLTDEQIAAATVDCYPLIKMAEPDVCGNACRLCPTPDTPPGEGRVHHDTWRVTWAESWRKMHALSLCQAHFDQYSSDPKGLVSAQNAEVAQRRARADHLLKGL